MRFHEITESRIDELFDTQGVVWKSDTVATFTVNGVHYTAFFKQDAGGGNYYDFSFTADEPDAESETGVKGRFDNTGTQGSGASKVFGYAVQCIAHFLRMNVPRQLAFSGFHNTGRNELYNRMAVKLGKTFDNLGYSLTMRRMVNGREKYTSFDLHRQFTPKPKQGPAYQPPEKKRPKTPEQEARERAELDAIFAELEALDG